MRVLLGKARHRRNKRWFREARGNWGRRKNLLRTVKETVVRSRAYAYRDRRTRKRDFRRLWITRITAACMQRGMRYSVFIYGLKQAGIDLNRKTLSQLAIFEPAVFDEIAEIARGAAAAE